MLPRLRALLNDLVRPVRVRARRFAIRGKIAPAPRPMPAEVARPDARRVLCLARFDPNGILTPIDNALALGRHSRFRWDLMNLYGYETTRGFAWPKALRLADYDAVFVHNTASYDSRELESLLPAIASYGGVKVLTKQDEQMRVNAFVAALGAGRFDVLLTCVPPAEREKVYPSAKLPRLAFVHILTGYVTDEMRALRYPPTDERPVDIGYRGSPQAFNFGRLPYEKRQIAEVFQKVCAERGLVGDIRFGWGDRFLGHAWFDFLGRSKATLGTESGGSVFDFDGEIERRVWAYLRGNRDAPFEDVWKRFLEPFEGNVDYRQIAPRHFEAAACRTVQILYEGAYSGIFRADRHYLSLRRDLANLDETIARLRDPAERRRLTEAAFEEIVMDDRWHYRSFVRSVDEALEASLAAR